MRLRAPLLLLPPLLQACTPLPAETLHAVPERAAAEFVPGTSTRADVLLRLGDPSRSDMGDSHFIYEWEAGRGGVVLGMVLGFPFPFPFAFAYQARCRCLVIRFLPDGRVEDWQRFDGDIQSLAALPTGSEPPSACERDSALESRIADWLARP